MMGEDRCYYRVLLKDGIEHFTAADGIQIDPPYLRLYLGEKDRVVLEIVKFPLKLVKTVTTEPRDWIT